MERAPYCVRRPFGYKIYFLPDVRSVRPEVLFVIEDLFLDIISFEQLEDLVLDITFDVLIARVVDRGFYDAGREHPAFEQLFPAHAGAIVLAVIGFELSQHRAEIRVVYPE